MRRGTTLIVATITFLGCVASLTATPCAVTSPLSCGTIIYYPQPPTDFLLDVNDPVDPATLDASDFTLNGTPATSVTLLNNNTRISFTFNTSPAVRGNNTMHIAAGAFDCVSNGPVLEFICDSPAKRTLKISGKTICHLKSHAPLCSGTTTAALSFRVVRSPRNSLAHTIS